MAYYSDQVSGVAVRTVGRRLIVRAESPAPCVQCYLAGRLAAWQRPVGGAVEFVLPAVEDTELILLLGVDAADAETDYFAQAFPLPADRGSRIEVYSYTRCGYLATDTWRVYLGADGSTGADTLQFERLIFPGGRHGGGWGAQCGHFWGFGPYGPGWGEHWGCDEWGFGCGKLCWTSPPKTVGDYPVRVAVADQAGNEASAAVQVVTVDTCPRPATELTVESYAKATDTLVLSWTPSPDLPDWN